MSDVSAPNPRSVVSAALDVDRRRAHATSSHPSSTVDVTELRLAGVRRIRIRARTRNMAFTIDPLRELTALAAFNDFGFPLPSAPRLRPPSPLTPSPCLR
jgi:hypothetical protein